MQLRALGRAQTATERESWDLRLSGLVGQRVSDVRYVELDYRDPDWTGPGADPGGAPVWDGVGFHSLDHGMELDLETGSSWWCTWQSPGGDGESLLFGGGSALTEEIEMTRTWNVAASALWKPLIGVPIVATEIIWDHWPATHGSPEMWCQSALTLAFDGGPEVIVALGDRDGTTGKLRPSADNVVVFRSREDASRLGLWQS
ncbi:hypothetical protein EON81_24880 [bacterium]|nr:MAG: hypothetical protein EON81_24880 [bacterium]